MKRMISTRAAETAEGIKDFVKQNDKTTEFCGNVEIDGNLKVNGSAPGGLHVYKVKGHANSGFDVYFLWTCNSDNMTVQSMTDELIYRLSSGSGFGMGIPAVKDQMGYDFCVVAYSGVLQAGIGSNMSDMTLNTVYKIY